MNNKLILIVTAIFSLLLGSCLDRSGGGSQATDLPNIVLIVADDLGYGEVGCYGQEIIRTPAIDGIAREGMRFTAFYSGSPVCAPSRCVLMTGMHTGHSYIRDNGMPVHRNPVTPFPGQNPIPDSVVTIAEILKDKGYATACIGKWGLGHTGTSGNPGNQGFDLFYGFKCQRHAHNHYPEFLWRNDSMEFLPGNDRSLGGDHHSQDLFTREALDFIREHQDGRFFLYLPFIIPHLSIQTTDPFLTLYKDSIPEEDYTHRGYLEHPYPRAGYAGMVTQMDDAIGQILEELTRQGLDEETIVIFTSDNGPTFDRLGGSDSDYFVSAGPFRGRKGSLLEGGIRVPLVVRWPGRIKSGTVNNYPSAFWDIFPTICDITGSNIPGSTDGISLLPSLQGGSDPERKDAFYWEFPSYGGQAALIKNGWKLIVQNLMTEDKPATVQLYDLSEDMGETTDISSVHPEIVKEMMAEMKQSHTHSELFGFTELEDFYKK